MSIRVARALPHLVPEVSPPDNPEVPHEWVAEAWEPREKELPGLRQQWRDEVPILLKGQPGDRQYWLRVSCIHCRTVCLATFDRTPRSVVEAITSVRRWPVPASCHEALVRHVMES